MKRALLAILLVAAAVFAASTPAAPQTGMVIRPGVGIGKVTLGMTLAQVRQALGRPRTVIRRIDYPSGSRYVEYSWEFEGDRAPITWTIGVRSATRAGALRVVRVATTSGSERTRERLGVGVRPRQIVKVYPDAACVSRSPRTAPYWGDWVVVQASNGGMTAFALQSSGFLGKAATHDVVEVLVQRAWFSKGPGHRSCAPDWRLW